MVAVRDSLTGLPVESVQGLPKPLQETLVRNQHGVAPLVLFVEWTKKLSEGATARFTKERLVVITPDSVNLYAADGSIKRRVRVADLAALHVSGPVKHSAGPSQNFVASVCLEVPRQFDIALDVVRDTRSRCCGVVSKLMRVLTILHRHHAAGKSCVELPVVSLRPGCLCAGQESELAYFRLKKTYAAGPHPHGKKGPLLAPVLPLVTDEMERRGRDDHNLQIAQAVTDAVAEIRRYRQENTANAAVIWALRQLGGYVEQHNVVRQHALRVAEKREVLHDKAARQGELTASVEAAMRAAREAYVAAACALDARRNEHEASVRAMRHEIEETERRISALLQEDKTMTSSFLQQIQELDRERADMAAHVEAMESELTWKQTSLPTVEALEHESEILAKAIQKLESDAAAVEEAKERAKARAAMRERLRQEQHALEMQVAEVMEEKRHVQTKNMQLRVQLSMATAKRNKLASALEGLQQQAIAARSAVPEQLALLERLKACCQDAALKVQVSQLEAVVSEDLQREIDMQEGIAKTMLQVASDKLLVGDRKEQQLLQKLERLRKARQLAQE